LLDSIACNGFAALRALGAVPALAASTAFAVLIALLAFGWGLAAGLCAVVSTPFSSWTLLAAAFCACFRAALAAFRGTAFRAAFWTAF
jgi:hypothetical protein